MCETIRQTLRKKQEKIPNPYFIRQWQCLLRFMHVELEVLQQSCNYLQASDMKRILAVERCTNEDQIRNEGIRQEMHILFPSPKKITIQRTMVSTPGKDRR